MWNARQATILLGLMMVAQPAEAHDPDRVGLVARGTEAPFAGVLAPMGFREYCRLLRAACTIAGFETRRALMTPDAPRDMFTGADREDRLALLSPLAMSEFATLPIASHYALDADDCEAGILKADCYLDSLPPPRTWLFDTAGLEARDVGSPIYKRVGLLPRGGGRYHVGKPYVIAGLKFRPAADPGYDVVGRASWYGRQYHSRMTSNGEWFDMEYLSAAHATMPLPSYAKVINLDNGREIIVRVNDRGPFVADRVIDVSKKAAEILGFRDRGLAKVRVQYIGPAPLGDQGTDLMAMNRELERSAAVARAESAPPKASLVLADAGPVMKF